MWVLGVCVIFQGKENFGEGLQFENIDFGVGFGLPKPKFKLLENLVNENKAMNKLSQRCGTKRV
jgi:hypothetical protein